MDTARKIAPEAVPGLRRFLSSLPLSARSVVLQFNWQRSGCISCYRPDHTIYDCPHVSRERSEELARSACQRWCGLIGEELMLLAAAASSDSYVAAAEARIRSRARPPFYFRKAGKRVDAISQQHQTVVHSAPAPKQLYQQQRSHQGVKPAQPPAAIAKPKPSAGATKAKPTPPAGQPVQCHDAHDAKQKLFKPSAAQPVQRHDVHINVNMLSGDSSPSRQDAPILPLPPLLPTPKGFHPTPPKTSKTNNSKPFLYIGSRPAKSPATASGPSAAIAAVTVVDVNSPAASSNKEEVCEADWRLSANDDWDVNRVSMDSHGRISGDLAMAQAKLCGSRRGRPASPAGSPNPKKFVCISDEQHDGDKEAAEPAVSQDLAEHKPSQDMADFSSQPSRKTDYELWDLKRYQHAITLEARRRFWKYASEAAQQKLTAELLQLSPGSNTLKQARTMGWLRKDGEQNP